MNEHRRSAGSSRLFLHDCRRGWPHDHPGDRCHWGLPGLAKIERILLLEGLPNLQDIGKVNVGENTEEILNADLALERSVLPVLKDGIAHCESVGDYVSRELLVAILDDSEEHVDFLETQLELIGKVGLQNYQQSQMARPQS